MRGYRVHLLRDLDPEVVESLPRSFDLIGEIALIRLSPEQERYLPLIREAIRTQHPQVIEIYLKGTVNGSERIRSLEIPYRVTYQENGLQLLVELGTVFFSNRLSRERQRILDQTQPGEIVVDLFAGVGPCGLLLAKKRAAFVYLCELNPRAIELCRLNAKLNRITNVQIFEGDARSFLKQFPPCDRVIMNLPFQAIDFLPAVIEQTGPGTKIHLYRFHRTEQQNFEYPKLRLLQIHPCIEYSAFEQISCFDLERTTD